VRRHDGRVVTNSPLPLPPRNPEIRDRPMIASFDLDCGELIPGHHSWAGVCQDRLRAPLRRIYADKSTKIELPGALTGGGEHDHRSLVSL
jgi:hypothetical protein